MNIKIIKTRKAYEIALKRLDSLMEEPDPIDALKFYMSQNGLTNKDLEDVIGNKGRVSDVLNRKRELSKAMIRAIAKKFSIPMEILMKEYPLVSRNHHGKKLIV